MSSVLVFRRQKSPDNTKSPQNSTQNTLPEQATAEQGVSAWSRLKSTLVAKPIVNQVVDVRSDSVSPSLSRHQAESRHSSASLSKVAFEPGVGQTVRFCKSACDVQQTANHFYASGGHFLVKSLSYVQGQWMLVMANYEGFTNENVLEKVVPSYEQQWNTAADLAKNAPSSLVHRRVKITWPGEAPLSGTVRSYVAAPPSISTSEFLPASFRTLQDCWNVHFDGEDFPRAVALRNMDFVLEDEADANWRLHQMVAGAGEVVAVWRSGYGPDFSSHASMLPVSKVAPLESLAQRFTRERRTDMRISHMVFSEGSWRVMQDICASGEGQTVLSAATAADLEVQLLEVQAGNMTDGTNWHVVGVWCKTRMTEDTQGEWVACLRDTSDGGAVKETVFVSSDLDVIGRKFDFLRRHDKDTMIRHVVYDGVQVMIVAQGSHECSGYTDEFHLVRHSHEVERLVHDYLERGLTLKEHWEVAVAADLHQEQFKNAEDSRCDELQEQVAAIRAKWRAATDHVAQLQIQLVELNQRVECTQARQAADGMEIFRAKLHASMHSLMARLQSMNTDDKKSKMKDLQRKFHPDKNEDELKWLFDELFCHIKT